MTTQGTDLQRPCDFGAEYNMVSRTQSKFWSQPLPSMVPILLNFYKSHIGEHVHPWKLTSKGTNYVPVITVSELCLFECMWGLPCRQGAWARATGTASAVEWIPGTVEV